MFVLAILIVVFCYLVYKFTARPLNFPTGPWNLPLVGFLPFLGDCPHVTFGILSKKYGDVFSINLGGYQAVVLNSYESIKDAMKESNFAGRPQFPYQRFRSNQHGILFADGNNWRELRRFTLRHLRDLGFGKSSLEGVIQEEIRELIKSFEKKVGKPIVLHNTFNLSIVNALWNLTAGERFDLDDPTGTELIASISNVLKSGSTFRKNDLIPGMSLVTGLPEHLVNYVQKNKSVYGHLVKKHEEIHSEDDKSDFIHAFLTEMKKDEKNGIQTPFTGETGVENLKVCILDLFVAGSETTSTTLLWLFLMLSKHPEIQEKVQRELDMVVGQERFPSLDDKNSLPYTEAVLQEVLRYASILPLSLLHSCLADTKFRSYVIPKDTIIIPNLYHVLHDPKIWESPDDFNPEHFLTPEGKLKHSDHMISFSTGKRVCLGESLAKIELFLFATALLQQFTFQLAEDQPKPSAHPPWAIIRGPDYYSVVLTSRKELV